MARLKGMSIPSHFPSVPPYWQEKVCKIKRDSIFLRLWQNSASDQKISPKILFLIHGWGEHSGRYLHFSHYLKDDYGLIAAIDLPGHGESEGNRGDAQSEKEFFEAIEAGIQYTLDYFKLSNKELKTSPEIHLFGHSFGGMLAALIAGGKRPLSFEIKKLILSAPLLEFAKPLASHKLLLGFIGDFLFPRLAISTELNLNHLSRDVSVVKAVENDPLCHQKITPRMFKHLLNLMNEANEVKEVPMATCLFLPLADQIVSASHTHFWFDRLKVSGSEKVLNSFPGAYHEAFNDDCRFQAFTALQKFVSSS